jgi:hypothetical protein
VLFLVKLRKKVKGYQGRPIDYGWPRELRDDIKRLGESPWVVVDESTVRKRLVVEVGGEQHRRAEVSESYTPLSDLLSILGPDINACCNQRSQGHPAPAKSCHACHSVAIGTIVRCAASQCPVCEHHLQDASQLPARLASVVREDMRSIAKRLEDMGVAQAELWVCCAWSFFARQDVQYDMRLLNDMVDW